MKTTIGIDNKTSEKLNALAVYENIFAEELLKKLVRDYTEKKIYYFNGQIDRC